MAPFTTTSSLILTVSRQLGSGGDAIAKQTADLLGLRLIDGDDLRQHAIAAGIPEFALEELTFEGQRSLAGKIVHAVWNLSPLPSPNNMPAAMAPSEAAHAEFARMMSQLIRDLAKPGGICLLGMGGQMLLANEPRALHVHIYAPFEMRAQAVRAREHITLSAARREVRACDNARCNYLKHYYNADWDDPRLYHLLINTAKTSQRGAAAAIVGLVRAFAADPARPAAAPGAEPKMADRG